MDPKLKVSHSGEKNTTAMVKGSESNIANNNDFEATKKGRKPAAFLSEFIYSGNFCND